MAKEVRLPGGLGVMEGKVVHWLVKEGEEVGQGQLLGRLMTERGAVELPAPSDGVVLKLLVGEGEAVRIGQGLVLLGELGERYEPPHPILAAPAVRRRAQELGVDLSLIRGSGPGGRVEMEDLERFTQRAAIQGRVGFHLDEVDLSGLELLRSRAAEGGKGFTHLPFILKAAVAGLKRFPRFNAQLDEERGEILLISEYNIGVEVALPKGLILRVIKGVDRKSILELSRELEELTEQVREGTPLLEGAEHPGFRIANISLSRGLIPFPVKNLPGVVILGIGRTQPRPVVREGQVVVRPMAYLSLSYDQRVADEEMAAAFMGEVIRCLETPGLLMLEGA